MKSFIAIALLLIPPGVFAKILPAPQSQKVCETLRREVADYCLETLCEDFTLIGEICVHDGDFIENYQACIHETFENRIKGLNQDQQGSPLTCTNED